MGIQNCIVISQDWTTNFVEIIRIFWSQPTKYEYYNNKKISLVKVCNSNFVVIIRRFGSQPTKIWRLQQ